MITPHQCFSFHVIVNEYQYRLCDINNSSRFQFCHCGGTFETTVIFKYLHHNHSEDADKF